jgi:hypothetical protein
MADDNAVAQNQDVSTTADTGSPETGKSTNQPNTDSQGVKQSPDSARANSGDDADRRFKGIQADLQKERKARQQYERQVQQYQTELQSERRRIAALAGVNTPSPEEAEAEEIRQRLEKVLTRQHLSKMLGFESEEELDELRNMRGSFTRLRETENWLWNRHASDMVGRVATRIGKELGGDLSKRQQDKLATEYALKAHSDPEFLQRHESGDDSLVEDFAKEFIEDWIEPVRRRAITSEADRFRRVPNGRDRSLTTTGEKKIDVTNDKAVEDMLVAGFRERGGEFGRRR